MSTKQEITPAEPNESGSSLQRVLDLCGQINAERELPRLLELIAREGSKLLECERVTIFLLDRETCELISQVTLDGEKIRLDARLGIAGACAMTGQVIKVEDAQQDQRFYTAVDARTSFRTRTVLAIPLRNPAGEVIGTFQCINTRHGTFTPEDEQVAQALASQAASPSRPRISSRTSSASRRNWKPRTLSSGRKSKAGFRRNRSSAPAGRSS